MVVLLVAVAVVAPLAAAQGYGTTVDEAWYERMSSAYQNPPYKVDEERGTMHIEWEHTQDYPAIRFDLDVSEEGVVVKSAGNECSLDGAAGIAEEAMRHHVSMLGNLDDEAFRQEILTLGEQSIVMFEGDSDLEGDRPVVALVGQKCLPPLRVVWESHDEDSVTGFKAFFSLKNLEAEGAIINGTLVLATGLTPDAHCSFDLAELP